MDLIKRSSLSPEILAEVRRLHFFTRRLADAGVGGQYRSAFRGQGMEFEEVREYVPGMDIRSIDWKVTARSRQPYIKTFREERELSVMLAVDVSASTLTGTRGTLRDQVIANIGAVLTLIALQSNDKVGLLTFADKIETYHPPRKSRGAVWRILHEVLAPGHYGTHTNLGSALRFLNGVLKRRSVVFLLSDFFAENYEAELALLSKGHDITALVISDPIDIELPESVLLDVCDPETGETQLIDLGDPAFRKQYKEQSLKRREQRDFLFRKYRINVIEVRTDRPFMPPLRQYFGKRSALRVR